MAETLPAKRRAAQDLTKLTALARGAKVIADHQIPQPA
jgi:hypothetical protein